MKFLSQETEYISAMQVKLLILSKVIVIFVRNIRDTYIHFVGRMQSYSKFKQVVLLIATGL